MTKPYCVMPFIHVKQFQNHVFGPCCEFENKIQNRSNNVKVPRVEDSSIIDSFNSDYFKEIRKEMIEGKIPAGCERCLNKEKMGVNSYRIFMNDKFELKNYNINQSLSEIKALDISFSNECNLTCRMCGPSYSTKWNSVWGKFSSLYNKKWSLDTGDKGLWKMEIEDPSMFTNLEYIKIMGGEPFISKEHNSFIQLMPKNMIQNIFFEYNTNGTIFPDDQIIEKLKLANGGVIKLSIDGIGELNEYIRPGVSWEKIDNVIKLWFSFITENKNWEIHFAPCWQALNIHFFEEYIDYVQQFSHIKSDCEEWPWIGSNRVLTPEPLTIYVLPKRYKDNLIKKYKKNDIKTRYPRLRKTLIKYLSLDYGESQGSYHKKASMVDFNEFNLAIDSSFNLDKFIELKNVL